MALNLGKCLNNLKEKINDILKSKNGEQTQISAETKKEIILLFIAIKKSCRKDKLVIRQGREELQISKSKADTFRLHLQNLLYEISHLKKEIRICYLFKSLDENIDLLPEDQYTSIYGNEQPGAHTYRLLRLQRELELRRRLCSQFNDLLLSKKLIYKDILLNIERNSLFIPALKSLIKGSKPLKDVLKLSLSKNWQLEGNVMLLPQPLYVLFVNLYAIHVGPNPFLNVEVVNEDRVPVFDKLSDCSFRPHSLMLRISVKSRIATNEQLEMNIRYFSQLGIATISLKEESADNKEIALLNILRYIEPKDFGDIIPVSRLLYQLTAMNIHRKKLVKYLKLNNYGQPYIWLQKLCSVDTLLPANDRYKRTSLRYTIYVMDRIRDLWTNISKMQQQIKCISSRNLEAILPSNMPTRPKCSLAQWSNIDWNEFEKLNKNKDVIKLFDKYCTFYRGVLVSGLTKLECWVCISGKNAFSSAIWLFSLHSPNKKSAIDNIPLKEMENLINKKCQTDCNLYLQLRKAMIYLDSLLNLESRLEILQKTQISPMRGRMRYRIEPGNL